MRGLVFMKKSSGNFLVCYFVCFSFFKIVTQIVVQINE